MKRLSLIRNVCLLAFLAVGAVIGMAQKHLTAADVMSRTAAAIAPEGKTTILTFDLHGASGIIPATLKMDRHAYVLDSKDIHIWFDGTTQWTFVPGPDELTISEPTADEAFETNPFAVISQYANHYNARLGKATEGRHSVILTPKAAGSGITQALLTVDSRTYRPAGLEVTMSNGQKMKMTVRNLSTAPRQPLTVYRHDAKTYPAQEIIDLR